MAPPHAIAVETVKDVTVARLDTVRVLDAHQIEKIGKELYALGDNELLRKLVLDLNPVQHLSSGALGMLINLQRKRDAAKGKLILCGLRPEIRQIFKLTKLEKLFAFEKDRNEALKAFGILAPQSAR